MTFVAMLAATPARADEDATSPARPGYEGSDHLVWWTGRKVAEERGLVVDGTYSVEGFYAPQLANQATLGGLFAAELDADFGTLARDGLGQLHVSAFAIHGRSPTGELMDLHGISGNAAAEDVRLFEAWYEQPLGPFALRAGLIAADQEFVYADPADTLINATFGITTQFSVNMLGPVYPVAAPGVSGRFEDGPLLLQLAVYDGTQPNDRGIPTALGPDSLVIGEATLWRDVGVGAWHHSERGDGVYLTLDHELPSGLAGWARAGYSPEGPVPVYLDAGVQVKSLAHRPEDIISVGLAYARAPTGGETLVEASYEAQIAWLTIQPDLQLVMQRDRTVGIAGLRTTVVF